MKNKWIEVLPQKDGYMLNLYANGKKKKASFFGIVFPVAAVDQSPWHLNLATNFWE